jgi:hypothetical protein
MKYLLIYPLELILWRNKKLFFWLKYTFLWSLRLTANAWILFFSFLSETIRMINGCITFRIKAKARSPEDQKATYDEVIDCISWSQYLYTLVQCLYSTRTSKLRIAEKRDRWTMARAPEACPVKHMRTRSLKIDTICTYADQQQCLRVQCQRINTWQGIYAPHIYF